MRGLYRSAIARVFLSCALAGAAPAQDSAPQASSGCFHEEFVDPEDGKIDASAFLESAYGFVPMGTIITDPAVGYGGGLGLIFIRPNTIDGKPAHPDILKFAPISGS